MKYRILLLVILFLVPALRAQRGVQFQKEGTRKCEIPFRLIHNLMFIQCEINGVPLTMLVDTGVDDTILFSLQHQQEIDLETVRKVKVVGLGGGEPVEGLVASGNRLKTGTLEDKNHTLFIVLDQEFNFSATVGIPVNGILGARFFENFPVEIDYVKRRLIVYRKLPDTRKFERFRIQVEENKPYLHAQVVVDTLREDVRLLIDTGNSDAVWLFPERIQARPPADGIQDFLGRGLGGDIRGIRGRISGFSLGTFSFARPLAAFPSGIESDSLVLLSDRQGSLGSEVLRRFRVIFDYPSQTLYLKRNRAFMDPFRYNMSGLEIHHEGTTWERDPEAVLTVSHVGNTAASAAQYQYQFRLKPVYMIASVREKSPAALAGLQSGDFLEKINGRYASDLELQEITNLLQQREGRTVRISVLRRGRPLKFTFALRDEL